MASSPAMPFHSQMILSSPRYSFSWASMPSLSKLGFRLGCSRHCSVQMRVLEQKQDQMLSADRLWVMLSAVKRPFHPRMHVCITPKNNLIQTIEANSQQTPGWKRGWRTAQEMLTGQWREGGGGDNQEWNRATDTRGTASGQKNAKGGRAGR